MSRAGQDTHCGGWCASCGRPHFIDTRLARPAARELMDFFDRKNHIDLAGNGRDGRLSTTPLFGPARGKMFGVLLCRDREQKERVLYGFSGQMNGHWQVPGWVGPLFDVDVFTRLADPEEREIKAMGRDLAKLPPGSEAANQLRQKRKNRSARLMKRIFSLYGFVDFHGRDRLLAQVFTGPGNMPTGTGDCCAPRLLAHAAAHHLYPVSLAEFYYGRENRSRTRHHKRFYSSCRDKCHPILGALLCGRELLHARD